MKIVLCGGCFNKIHKGHVYFLKKCKEFGYLIVVLANDKNNRKPYALPASRRKINLRKLGIADKIVVGHPNDFIQTIDKYKPDIVALGYDQKLSGDVRKYIKTKNIKLVKIKKFGSYSSRRLQ